MKVLNSDIKYIVGRNNLAVTIFVPYDCPNNCPFCTSKEDYKDSSNFSLKSICESIYQVSNIKQIRDIVITGGEPFADLEKLQTILNVCKLAGKHIYINTTLPAKSADEASKIIGFIVDNKDIISGLNISRHMMLKTNLEADSMIYVLHRVVDIPLRINSVLLDVKAEESRVNDFIEKYVGIVDSINFRGDYTKVKTQDDLRTLDHPILNILFNNTKLKYLNSGGCLVCNNNDFVYRYFNDISYEDRNVYISLHRGYEHSLVIKGNNYILNDIIIKQDGKILMDWDGRELDIYTLKQQWK